MTDTAAQTNTGAGEGDTATANEATGGNTLITSEGSESEVSGNEATTATTEAAATAEGDPGNSESTEGDAGKNEPIEYGDFSLPEGIEADDVSGMVSLIKENNVPKEIAQKLVDYEDNLIQETRNNAEDRKAKFEEKIAKRSEEWYQETVNDKDIGGDKLKEILPVVNRARLQFADKDFSAWLDKTGYGNNKMFVKFFHNIGKAISEDSFHLSRGEGAGSKKSAAEVLYPSAQNG